ncbi:MAG: MotA/TolQ/ExbB proton channel family protein [Elusimicrobia bacterium]|nr:MotA/TolQ/ExbB proton channel family protein [Elusimicrobiota bacterium]
MDLATIAGTAGILFLIALGVISGEVGSIFVNAHGILIVFGGTFAAMLINTPIVYVKDTFLACLNMFRSDPYADPAELVPIIVRLSEQVQQGGLQALRAADPQAAGGFLGAAATTALEYNNPEFVRRVLETEVNNQVDRANEVINVIRTAGVVSPMFGLIGTLLGIIKVLQQIADPKAVGGSMAVAITSAFYGIMFANLFCIPIAGKLRMRLWQEIKMKAMVVEGVIGMMQGTVPLVLERRLLSYK